VAARLPLDREGLVRVEHGKAVKDFCDKDNLRHLYCPEAEHLAEVTGAYRVVVFDHTIRRRIWGGVDRATGIPPLGGHHRP
jgi:hypothetical protein